MLQSFLPLGLDQVCCQIYRIISLLLLLFFLLLGDGGLVCSSLVLIVSLCQAVRFKQNSASAQEDGESEVTGRVVGTVRRHIPIDTRDPPGAILHYYVGDSYDPSRQVLIQFLPLTSLLLI